MKSTASEPGLTMYVTVDTPAASFGGKSFIGGMKWCVPL